MSGDADALRELCRDERTRDAVAILAEERRALTVNDLTKSIVASLSEDPITEVDEAAVTRIESALVERGVPALEDAGFVEYEADRRLVVPTERFAAVAEQVPTIVGDDRLVDSAEES